MDKGKGTGKGKSKDKGKGKSKGRGKSKGKDQGKHKGKGKGKEQNPAAMKSFQDLLRSRGGDTADEVQEEKGGWSLETARWSTTSV